LTSVTRQRVLARAVRSFIALINSGRATDWPGGIRTHWRSPTFTAYWFDDQCHASMTCWDFLCGPASPETPAGYWKSQQHRRWLGDASEGNFAGSVKAREIPHIGAGEGERTGRSHVGPVEQLKCSADLAGGVCSVGEKKLQAAAARNGDASRSKPNARFRITIV
jgi:hypothetical protein